MEIHGRALLCTGLIALALGGAGCGSDDDRSASEPATRVSEETADPLPKLDRGWRPLFSRVGGFALGVPPGWTAQPAPDTTSTLVRSPRKLAAVSITADRTDEALALALDTYAERTLAALPGFQGGVREEGAVRRFRHPYNGAQIKGMGVAEHNEAWQDVHVVVLRRDRMVTLVAVVAANARRKAASEQRIALEIVRTIRSRPPTAGVSG